MDFDALYLVLPKYSTTWTLDDIEIWLNFIGLSGLTKKFSIFFLYQKVKHQLMAIVCINFDKKT